MIGRTLLGLVILALVGIVALALIGIWDRHSQETATLDSSGVYERGYPSRPINVVVPFPAGGPSDVVARVVTEHMGNVLGQSMVIENVSGAGGTIGSARVAAAPPDGYTLLAGSMGSHVAAPVLTPNLKYDARCAGPERTWLGTACGSGETVVRTALRAAVQASPANKRLNRQTPVDAMVE
jgi:Tripartite tricarboxylate transporter family receptor